MKIGDTLLASLAVLMACAGFSSCKRQIHNPLSVGSVGAPWEVLVVMDKSAWEAPEGRALFEVLDMDIPGLPASEPMFKISRCDKADFTGILKPVRNIIQVEISDIYSMTKFHFYEDLWASNQAVLTITSPDKAQFAAYVTEHADELYSFFEEYEMKRNIQYIRKSYNRDLSELILKQFGVKIMVPKVMTRYKQADGFFWASNDMGQKRQDLVVYTFPYTDVRTFTPEYLNHKRDSVMKANIPGGPAGSYMARQEDVPTDYRAVSINGKYAAVIRGLWEVRGDMMGGPYVSVSRLDEINQRIVTAEVFLYAPEEYKRNLIRYNESVIYNMQLPGEFSTETN